MGNEGIVFDIQRFSVHDGPGIRTLVFLKGCPLKCPWCSNPESQRFELDLFFNPEKCIGCRKCIEVCSQRAIIAQNGQLSFNRERCQNCGKCAQFCYAEARVIRGSRMNVDKVAEEVLKDEAFYNNSGGGVTLGGGEPLAQANFTASILKKCKQKGLHTAIETAGCVPWSQIEMVLPYADLFLYDVKHMDSKKHEKYVEVDNQLILANLKKLVESKKEVVVCTPLIPDFNDSIKEIDANASYAARLGIRVMHLLPYHRFGISKYRFLGRPYPFLGRKELTDEQIAELKETAAAKGLWVKVGG
jgi:pyruvate formate lyase activating enzyme